MKTDFSTRQPTPTAFVGILPLASGGTGRGLADPNADRIMFWDDSAGQIDWLTAGTGLTITGTTITATGGGGGGDLTGHITSVGTVTSLGSFTLAQLSAAVSDANIARIDAGQTFTGNQRIDGQITVGGASVASIAVHNKTTASGATDFQGFLDQPLIDNDITNEYISFATAPATDAVAFTLNRLTHFFADAGVFGAGSAVSGQYGFSVSPSLDQGDTNFGFYGELNVGSNNNWNVYIAGTAPNYFEGNVTCNGAFEQTPTYSTVASGSTITLTTSTNHLLYDRSSTSASLTVTLPSTSLTNGQIITIATRSAITSLTVNGGTIYGAPTTLAAGGFASFIYSEDANAWFRRG